MNSSRFVRLALEYEIARQRQLLTEGRSPAQETRLWNENHDITVAMRSKEESMDYRYFPEPDLPIFSASKEFLAHVEEHLVELPYCRARRMAKQYALPAEHARALCADKQTADYFEACVAAGASPQTAHSWLFGEVRKQLNHHNTSIEQSPITAARLATLLKLLDGGDIHGKIAKQTLEAIATEDKEPQQIIDERGWKSVRGADLQKIVRQVIDSHPQAAQSIRAGEGKSIGFLIGQVMQRSDGQADPQETNKLVRDMIQTT